MNARTDLSIGRRRLLTYALSSPVVTIAAGFGVNLAVPSTALASPTPLMPADSVDYYDVGDSIVQFAAPTMPLVKLSVGTDGKVTLEMPRLENGQGIATALGMMIAEEMDVPLSDVIVNSADAQPELRYNQITGGSSSVRCFDPVLPVMAAQARARLLAYAAQQWALDPSTLRVEAGVVIAPDGRSATYGSLTVGAATIPLPSAQPKHPSQYTVIGKFTGRLDARDIVTGKKKFTMDRAVPNARPTMLRMPSQIRGQVVSVNNLAAVKAMPGVIDVVVVPPGGSIVLRQVGVAVMAETFGQAWDGARALDITWGDGTNKGQSDATIAAALKAANPPLAAPPLGALTVGGEFEFPAATACPLEVECAIVDARADRAEIWAGMQTPIVALQATAADLGLPEESVKAHVIPSGGAFGRRLFWDPVQVAAYVSKATGRVCKLMYHRSDDIRHTRLRPPQVHNVRATVIAGTVATYEQHIAAIRLDARHGYGEKGTAQTGAFPEGMPQAYGNMNYEQFFFKTMVASPYNYGFSTKVLTPVTFDWNTVSYRSVHIQPARLVEEIITDEIAKAMGIDPVAFRLQYLRLQRARDVLQRVAGAAQWGKAMPAGFAQGVGVHQESRAFTACIVELDARDPLHAKVVRATIAIDVGKPINPSGIEQQCHGGLAEAISLVLHAGVTIKDGLPQEGSYSQYHWARMVDFPKQVEVIIMPNVGDPIAGMGEPGMSAPSGAIANAYARATGIKPRKFPLNARDAFVATPPGELPAPPL
ncbi:MAG TPA: molybdopterin cofactor-binding domain-containing protein [Burkholderiales bacterium]|nr:molybdopterin cofactor-binding domain-containing protein [Burkholderiales bacterium]